MVAARGFARYKRSMATSFPYLIELVEASTPGLKDISRRRMFGCDAFFAGDRIFALLWKTERIGVKLVDPEAYARLLALPGAEPWQIGAKVMGQWVLVPEEMHDDGEALAPWVRMAHAQAQGGAAKVTTKAAKVTAKATAKVTRKVTKAPARKVTKGTTKKAASR